MKNGMKTRTKSRTMLLGLLATLVLAGQALAAKEAPKAPVDVNQASVEQLMTLPGVGATKAQAIIAYRQATPFKTSEELVNVKGIGDKLYAKLAPFVTVSGATTSQQSQKPGTAEKSAR